MVLMSLGFSKTIHQLTEVFSSLHKSPKLKVRQARCTSPSPNQASIAMEVIVPHSRHVQAWVAEMFERDTQSNKTEA